MVEEEDQLARRVVTRAEIREKGKSLKTIMLVSKNDVLYGGPKKTQKEKASK